jgi:hypothetical protein
MKTKSANALSAAVQMIARRDARPHFVTFEIAMRFVLFLPSILFVFVLLFDFELKSELS